MCWRDRPHLSLSAATIWYVPSLRLSRASSLALACTHFSSAGKEYAAAALGWSCRPFLPSCSRAVKGDVCQI